MRSIYVFLWKLYALHNYQFPPVFKQDVEHHMCHIHVPSLFYFVNVSHTKIKVKVYNCFCSYDCDTVKHFMGVFSLLSVGNTH